MDFYPNDEGALEVCGQRRDIPTGSQAPSGGCWGIADERPEQELWGPREVQRRGLCWPR